MLATRASVGAMGEFLRSVCRTMEHVEVLSSQDDAPRLNSRKIDAAHGCPTRATSCLVQCGTSLSIHAIQLRRHPRLKRRQHRGQAVVKGGKRTGRNFAQAAKGLRPRLPCKLQRW